MWASSIGVVGLALNLRAYDFVSQELRAAEDAEFESFYTKNILLNEGVRMASSSRPTPRLVSRNGIRRSQRSRLVIDRTSLYWGLLTILVLAVLFSSYLIG